MKQRVKQRKSQKIYKDLEKIMRTKSNRGIGENYGYNSRFQGGCELNVIYDFLHLI